MKRGYTALEFKQKIRKLRAVRPDISISSDFIVGFPGETDADFDKTMKLIEEVGFDQSFSFIYSRRPGTPRSEEHTSELQSLMRISYAVFCLKKKKKTTSKYNRTPT